VNLKDLQLQVHLGDGLVAHFGGAVVVLNEAPLHSAFVNDLLALTAVVCEENGLTPGRSLIRKLAGLVTSAEPEEVPSFAVLAGGDDGLALMLCGSMDAQIFEVAGKSESLSGRDVATWVDRVIRTPMSRMTMSSSDALEAVVDPRSDLRAGVVSGSGVTVLTTARSRAAPEPRDVPQGLDSDDPLDQRADDRPVDKPVESAGSVGFVLPEPSSPVSVDSKTSEDDDSGPQPNSEKEFISLSVDDPLPGDEIEPLPRATRAASSSEQESGTTVRGILCSRGHMNDPKTRFCAVCGISMVHQTHDLVSGPRPPLGVIVLDDGSSFSLDNDYVIGRDPESSDLVRTGRARPLVIVDQTFQLSRVHARILLREWDVCIEDAGSANGTRILRPDSDEWTQLVPDNPTVITPGTKIGFSDRELVFDSHFAAN